jgi:hypothetical protein
MDEDDLFMILTDIYKENEHQNYLNQLMILNQYIKKICNQQIKPPICNVSVPKNEEQRSLYRNIIGDMIEQGNTGRIYTVKGNQDLIIKASVDDNATLHELFVNIVVINDFILNNPLYAKKSGFY